MIIVSECAADSSDAVNGPTVSDDPKEEQVGEVVEEGPAKSNEGEMPHRSHSRFDLCFSYLSQLCDFLNSAFVNLSIN